MADHGRGRETRYRPVRVFTSRGNSRSAWIARHPRTGDYEPAPLPQRYGAWQRAGLLRMRNFRMADTTGEQRLMRQ